MPIPKSSQRLSQTEIYNRLREVGTQWLKKHVLFADRQMIVVQKPPNLVCQVDGSLKAEKLASGFYSLNPVFKGLRRWFPFSKPCNAHRLDKPTTGCLVIPLNPVVAREISIQIKQKTFQKTYLALVRGGEKSFDTKSGRLEDRLLYTDGRGSVDKSGKEAITDWELLSSSKKAPVSLLMFKLVTGKKHQLRLHASKVLKAPILGDDVHSLSNVSQSILDVTTVPENRLFLHAHEVSLCKYREDGKRYRLGVRAPLADDFQRICKELDILIPPSFTEPSLLIDDRVAGENSDLKLWNAVEPEQLSQAS